MKEKFEVITCPNCGREYLPAEIYIPNSFFGKPEYIKLKDNKIDKLFGTSMDLKEHYCCDSCGKSFNITAKISFNTEIDDKHDFEEEYETKLKTSFTLKEQ